MIKKLAAPNIARIATSENDLIDCINELLDCTEANLRSGYKYKQDVLEIVRDGLSYGSYNNLVKILNSDVKRQYLDSLESLYVPEIPVNRVLH